MRQLLLGHLYLLLCCQCSCPLQNPPQSTFPAVPAAPQQRSPTPTGKLCHTERKWGFQQRARPLVRSSLAPDFEGGELIISSSKGKSCLQEFRWLPGAAVSVPSFSLPRVRVSQDSSQHQDCTSVSLAAGTTSTGLWPYCRLWELGKQLARPGKSFYSSWAMTEGEECSPGPCFAFSLQHRDSTGLCLVSLGSRSQHTSPRDKNHPSLGWEILQP